MDSRLYEAASSGDYETFISLINADPGPLHQTTTQKNTVLHVAAEFNQLKIVEEILRQRNSILYITNARDETALHFAARFGNVKVAECLIECAKRHGLEAEKELLTMANIEKETVLHDAVRRGHDDMVKVLLEECPNLATQRNESGESALFVAVEKGYMKIAGEILKVNCSYLGRDGANALHALILRTQKRYTQSLIETPIRVYLALPVLFLNSFLPEIMNLPYWERKTTHKLDSYQKEFLQELLKKFPDLQREADDYKWLPLHYAANLGSEEFVVLCLQHQPSLAYEKDKMGVSALHIAAKEGRFGAVKTILKYCPDSCELLDSKQRTALHVAVQNGQAFAVKKMLEMPYFINIVNQQDEEGNTALHLAAITGNYVILMYLAAKGRVDKKITNKEGLTTNDFIRSSTKFRWYEKSFSIARLEFHGALRGMQQVLARKSPTEPNPDIDKPQKSLHKEEKPSKKQTANAAAAEQELKTSQIWSEVSDANLVVATIIATVTFSAAFQVPGGYNSKNGMAVLKDQMYFRLYMISDAFSFGYAAASMFVTFFTGLFGKDSGFSYPRRWVTFLTGSSLWFMVFSYMMGISAVMGDDSSFARLLRAVASLSFIWPVFLLGALAVNWFSYFP